MANSLDFAKFAKVFSHKSFVLYGTYSACKVWTTIAYFYLLKIIFAISPLIQSIVGIFLDSRNVITASKPKDIHMLLPSQNIRTYAEHVLCTYLSLVISTGASI